MDDYKSSNIILEYHSKLNYQRFNMPRKILYYNGKLWLTSFGDNCIFIFDSYTEKLKEKITLLNLQNPRGIYPYKNYIYVACYGDPIGKIICINKDTLCEEFYFSVARPRGIIILNKEIFITEVIKNRISIYTLNGKFKRYIGDNILKFPRGLDIFNNNVIVADSGNNRIIELSITGQIINIIENFNSPNDVVTYENQIIVSEWYNKSIKIYNLKSENYKVYKIPIGSGYLSMISIYLNKLYISDENGYVHIFNIR